MRSEKLALFALESSRRLDECLLRGEDRLIVIWGFLNGGSHLSPAILSLVVLPIFPLQ